MRICQETRRKPSRLAASRQLCKRSVNTLLTHQCGELDAPRWLSWSVKNNQRCVQRANTAGVLDAVVVTPAAVTPDVFDAVCVALQHLVNGHEAAAVLAGALDALEQGTPRDATNEAARSRLIRQLQPAAQQHEARPCTHAGCKRCAAARARGKMCALAGCGIRTREGGKRLRRCITCRTARYCSEAHQLEDWQRHKPECFALRDRQERRSQRERRCCLNLSLVALWFVPEQTFTLPQSAVLLPPTALYLLFPLLSGLF